MRSQASLPRPRSWIRRIPLAGDVGAGNLATVVERKPLLALVADAEVIELDYQRALVSGLEQARAKGVVNREGGAEDGVGQLLMDEWYERPPERARAPFV